MIIMTAKYSLRSNFPYRIALQVGPCPDYHRM